MAKRKHPRLSVSNPRLSEEEQRSFLSMYIQMGSARKTAEELGMDYRRVRYTYQNDERFRRSWNDISSAGQLRKSFRDRFFEQVIDEARVGEKVIKRMKSLDPENDEHSKELMDWFKVCQKSGLFPKDSKHVIHDIADHKKLPSSTRDIAREIKRIDSEIRGYLEERAALEGEPIDTVWERIAEDEEKRHGSLADLDGGETETPRADQERQALPPESE